MPIIQTGKTQRPRQNSGALRNQKPARRINYDTPIGNSG